MEKEEVVELREERGMLKCLERQFCYFPQKYRRFFANHCFSLNFPLNELYIERSSNENEVLKKFRGKRKRGKLDGNRGGCRKEN